MKKIIKKTQEEKVEELNRKNFEKFIKNKVKLISEVMLVPFIKVHTSFLYMPDPKYPINIVMDMQYQSQYKQGFLTIHPNTYVMWNNNDKEAVIDGLVHEMCHTHTIKLSDMALRRHITKDEIMEEAESLTETMSEYVRMLIKGSKNKSIIYKITN